MELSALLAPSTNRNHVYLFIQQNPLSVGITQGTWNTMMGKIQTQSLFSCALSLRRCQALIEYLHMDVLLQRKSRIAGECLASVNAKGKVCGDLPPTGVVLPPRMDSENLWEHFSCPHK